MSKRTFQIIRCDVCAQPVILAEGGGAVPHVFIGKGPEKFEIDGEETDVDLCWGSARPLVEQVAELQEQLDEAYAQLDLKDPDQRRHRLEAARRG